jgi:hypothetical protein
MKASVLSGLFVATAAFGSSSIYLWNQLQDERTRAEELTTKSAELNTRIAELEAARGQFEERRFASANTFGSGPVMVGTGRPPPPVAGIKNEIEGGAPEGARWTVRPQPPVQSAAMQRMMRAQIRANNKRLYADVGSELGLSKEQANKLIELRTDQQIPTFASRPDIDPAEGHNNWAERQQKVQSDIADLIGPEKAAALREYEKTLRANSKATMHRSATISASSC